MAGDDVDRGQVARTRALDLARGDLARQLLGLHAEAAGFRSGDPVGDVLGLRTLQGHALAQPGERLGLLADDLGQRLARHLELVLRGDLLRRGEVEARLRLMHIGDGDGADLEAGLGQFELLGRSRAQLRHRVERVLRVEHVEVGLGHAQHQILAGDAELGVGQCGLQFALLELHPVLPAEQRLGELNAVAVAVVGVVVADPTLRLQIGVVPGRVRPQPDLRQQPRAPLHHLLLPSLVLRTRSGELRVVGERIAIHLHQVGGQCATGKNACDADRQDSLHRVLRS